MEQTRNPRRSESPGKFPAEVRDLIVRLASPQTEVKLRSTRHQASARYPRPARTLQRMMYKYMCACERAVDPEWAEERKAVAAFRRAYTIDVDISGEILYIKPRSDTAAARMAGAILSQVFSGEAAETVPPPLAHARPHVNKFTGEESKPTASPPEGPLSGFASLYDDETK